MGCTKMELTVLGQPIPKGRPRFTRSGHTYTPQRTKDYEKLIRSHLPDIHFSDVVHVEIIAIFKRPQRLNRKSDPDGLIHHDKRPDLDNVIKAVLDALNSILKDDSIVQSISAQKFYAEKHHQPRTIIKINTL